MLIVSIDIKKKKTTSVPYTLAADCLGPGTYLTGSKEPVFKDISLACADFSELAHTPKPSHAIIQIDSCQRLNV